MTCCACGSLRASSPHGWTTSDYRVRVTAPADRPTDVAELSYEQARDELVAVVARLEAGGETLEASLELWERGEALAARCQEWLDGARARLDAARAAEPTAADDDESTPSDDG